MWSLLSFLSNRSVFGEGKKDENGINIDIIKCLKLSLCITICGKNATKYDPIIRLDTDFYEIPASALRLSSLDIPIGGGAYFRLFPEWLFKTLVGKKIKSDSVYNFYLHPWEFEPGQPRMNIRFDYKIRHYTGLSKTAHKFENFLNFLKEKDIVFSTITEFIDEIEGDQFKN